MMTIETTAVVGNDRKLTVQLPPEVAPGPHQVVLVLVFDGPPSEQPQTGTIADWPVHDASPVDPNVT